MKKISVWSCVFLALALFLVAGCANRAQGLEITDSAMMSQEQQPIAAVSVIYNGQDIALNNEEAAALSQLFAAAEVEEFLYPDHNQGQYSDPLYTIKIVYADQSEEMIYSTETGHVFYRFTGTAGADGTAGYILIRSDEVFDLLSGLDWQE